MAKPRISAKYTATDDSHYMGIPARDLTEDEFEALSDEHKAMLAQSSFYDLRHGADEAAERASKRVERAEPSAPMAQAAVAEMPEPPAPKEAKK